jgi:LysR family transcriptional regulator, benzoate and cis,cis-muconate-responsive activator of ben and cat genes
MDFQTRYLRYFLAVADNLSFTGAAARLGVSQPALSQRVQGLERQIGFPLFVRSGRGIELTQNGEALLEPVRGLVGYANRIDRLIQDMGAGRSRPLVVGASIYSEQPERTALFSAFMAEYPDDEIELETGYTLALFQGLLDGEFDFAVVIGPPPEERFEWIALRWFSVDVIVPMGSPLASETKVSPEALRGVWIASFRRKRYPLLYDRLIQPLADLGAHVSYSPDQSPAGMLAYAALHDMVIPSAYVQHADEELAAHKMVRRRLHVEPVAAVMLVGARGARTALGERLWTIARRRQAERGVGA